VNQSVLVDHEAVWCRLEMILEKLDAALDRQSNICQADVAIAVRNKEASYKRSQCTVNMKEHNESRDRNAWVKASNSHQAASATLSEGLTRALKHLARRRRQISSFPSTSSIPTSTNNSTTQAPALSRWYGASEQAYVLSLQANLARNAHKSAEATQLYQESVDWNPQVAFGRVCFGRFLASQERWGDAVTQLVATVHLSFADEHDYGLSCYRAALALCRNADKTEEIFHPSRLTSGFCSSLPRLASERSTHGSPRTRLPSIHIPPHSVRALPSAPWVSILRAVMLRVGAKRSS
jgi:hypothetical protein